HHVTIGFQVPEALSQDAEKHFRRSLHDSFAGMIAYNFKPLISTRTGLFTADLGDEIRMDGKLGFADGRSANQAVDAVRTTLMLARGGLLMFEDQLNEGATTKTDSATSKLMDQLKLALNETTVKPDGSMVKVSLKAKVDGDLVKQVTAEVL